MTSSEEEKLKIENIFPVTPFSGQRVTTENPTPKQTCRLFCTVSEDYTKMVP